MLAKAFRTILPELSQDHMLEATAIHSYAGVLRGPIVTEPPYRSPHHTASYVSVIGGGTTPKPGEVTLAHRGVLFLDEFPEFERRSIDALRQPLEDGMKVRVKGYPKIHEKSGRFSFTVQSVELVGVGSLQKAYQLLKTKLEKEGLFEQKFIVIHCRRKMCVAICLIF